MVYISNAERKKQFVEAATRVIREHGLGAATTRKIAKAANAPLGSLHYCFNEKDELYEAVMRSLGWEGMSRMTGAVTPQMGVADATAAILRATATWVVATYEDTLTEWEVFIWATRSKKFAHIPVNVFRDWTAFLSELLRSAKRPDEPDYDFDALGRMVLSMIDGYSLQDQWVGEQAIADNFDVVIKVITRAIEGGDFAPAGVAGAKPSHAW